MSMKRRDFLARAATSLGAIGAVGASGMLAGCPRATGPAGDGGEHLTARVSAPTHAVDPGLHPLTLGSGRDGLLYVPASASPSHALPLLVLLHGAGQSSSMWFGSYGARAEANRFVMLAPDSRAMSWDVRFGAFGPDVQFIDQALRYTFSGCAIDPRAIALVGFSDGASYALSLGLANGDLFTQVVAYSPGFLVEASARGKPEIFVSHGKQDTVLPIDATSRKLVPSLRQKGYSVAYEEFSGGHEVPPTISDRAMAWLQARYRSA